MEKIDFKVNDWILWKRIYIPWKNTICEVIKSENTSIKSPLKRLKYLEMNQSNIFAVGTEGQNINLQALTFKNFE